MAETEDLKSFQCRFESDRGHQLESSYRDKVVVIGLAHT